MSRPPDVERRRELTRLGDESNAHVVVGFSKRGPFRPRAALVELELEDRKGSAVPAGHCDLRNSLKYLCEKIRYTKRLYRLLLPLITRD